MRPQIFILAKVTVLKYDNLKYIIETHNRRTCSGVDVQLRFLSNNLFALSIFSGSQKKSYLSFLKNSKSENTK